MFKRIFIMVTILSVLVGTIGLSSFAEEKNFNDVKTTDWYYEAVKTLSGKGIISGYDDGTFKPLESVNRDAFATMMVKTLDLKLETPSQAWFEDVSKDNWAYKYVESSKYYMTGYISGDDYYFKPEAPAVREDMAVALVKALKYETDGNLKYLETFEDADSISDNLKDYVATAVKYKLMSGSPEGDKIYFNPQSDLTRAETAALLMNLIKQEKVVVEEAEKVTFDNMDKKEGKDKENNSSDPSISDSEKTAQIEAIVKDDRIVLEWSKVDSQGFDGYKVVASQYDSTPTYPDNGSLMFISDIDKNRIEIKPYAGYNNGDFNHFEPGTKYYFAITTFYGDERYVGRTEDGVMPGDKQEIEDYVQPKVTAFADDDRVYVKWDKIDHPLLDGYKVVASKKDGTPIYPEDGYLRWITDKNTTSYEIKPNTQYSNGDFEKFESGESYYFTITAVYKDKKIAGNAVKVKMP